MMPTLDSGHPVFVDRIEVANLLRRYPSAPWPPEAHTAGWHGDEAPRVGDGVLLFYRRPTGADGWVLTWQWALVCDVGRWLIVLELPDALPGTGLDAGARVGLDADDFVHAVRRGAAQTETPSGFDQGPVSASRPPLARRSH